MMSDGSLSPFPLRGEEHGREKVAPSGTSSRRPPEEGKELRDGMCEMVDVLVWQHVGLGSQTE